MRVWAFEDASRRPNELLDAAVTAPQVIERGGDRFMVSFERAKAKPTTDFLLGGGPLDAGDDLDVSPKS